MSQVTFFRCFDGEEEEEEKGAASSDFPESKATWNFLTICYRIKSAFRLMASMVLP